MPNSSSAIALQGNNDIQAHHDDFRVVDKEVAQCISPHKDTNACHSKEPRAEAHTNHPCAHHCMLNSGNSALAKLLTQAEYAVCRFVGAANMVCQQIQMMFS